MSTINYKLYYYVEYAGIRLTVKMLCLPELHAGMKLKLRKFTIPGGYSDRLIMIDRLIENLNAIPSKVIDTDACTYQVHFYTDEQAGLFDNFMNSIIENVYQY